MMRFLNTEMVQVIKILHGRQGSVYPVYGQNHGIGVLATQGPRASAS